MRWLVVLAAGCFWMTPPVRFGAGKSSEETQQAGLAQLMPAQLSTEAKWQGEVRTAKIRVWADDDFRAQNIHWEKTFGDQLADANEVLGPLLGLRLEAEYHSWDHHAPANVLTDDLAELARVDNGDGVLSVVGLTSALELVTANFENLGYASLPGKYIMLRGFADRSEREVFARAFHDLPEDERENVVEARRRHKVAAIFLHELGHNLGAPHQEGDTLMSAMYSHHASAFSDGTRELMLATLDQRLGHKHASSPPPDVAKHGSVVVTISATGETLVGGRAIDAATLDQLFAVSLADDPDTQVVVRPDRAAPHDVIVRVLDRAKAAGLKHLSVAAD